MFSTWPDLLPFLPGARRCRGIGVSLVHHLASSRDVVALKMGGRSGLGRTVRAGLAVRGRISYESSQHEGSGALTSASRITITASAMASINHVLLEITNRGRF